MRGLDNWIRSYIAYTNEQESPEEYHIWVALSTIAGALKRQCFFDFQYFRLYPNLYIVLVAPPGRCKKSTAMRLGREILSSVPGLNCSADSTSREKLILDLANSRVDDHSSMTAYSSELATMLTTSGMDMVAFLTDIYESPDVWVHKTKGGGTQKIVGPSLNLIGCTTPDWMSSAMPLDTVGLGFTSRVIFVYQDTPRIKPPFPELTREQIELKNILREQLAVISSLHGEFHFDAESRERYIEWYKAQISKPNTTNDPKLDGYFERKPMHLVKVCMCVAAAKRNELVIISEDLVDAFNILAQSEERMPKVFAAVGKNVLSAQMYAVEDYISHGGDISYETLLGRFRSNIRKEELDEILMTLQVIHKIKSKPNGNELVYTYVDAD